MNEPWEASHVPTFGLNPTPVEPNKLVDTQSCLQLKLQTGFFVFHVEISVIIFSVCLARLLHS